MKNTLLMIALLMLIAIRAFPVWAGVQEIDMSVVKALAKHPVDEILKNSSVSKISIDKYWQELRSRNRPLIVFFYANNDEPSQRLATLILYVAREYSNRIDFRCVKVSEHGLPGKDYARRLEAEFSLDSTPGVFFYDNVKDKLVLKQESYIEADYKGFRSPQMFLWKTCYAKVEAALNKLLAD